MKLVKKKRIIALVLFCIISFNSATSVFAAEKGIGTEDILRIAYQNNIPTVNKIMDEPGFEVIYDSRYDDKPVVTTNAIPSSYDYYKTYRSGVTCRGTYPANSYALDVNVTFYINVFFKSTNAIGYESPVITGVINGYGATGYSDPSVVVSSWSAKQMTFKGTCLLHAGQTYTMTGTTTISF